MRSTIITAVVLCLCALTSASFAGDKSHKENNRQKKDQYRQKFSLKGVVPSQIGQSLLTGKKTKHAQHKTHNKQDDNVNNIIPLDPGRGDGRVPVAPVLSTPPARPGFVWKGDHWERARATSSPITGTPPVANGGGGVTVTSANSGPVIRDHRQKVVVRDHRQGIVNVTPVPVPPTFGGQTITPPPVVLNPPVTPSTPPRGSGGRPRFDQAGAPGGVTVSVVPGSQRPRNVTGSGGSSVDKAIESVLGLLKVNGGITPAGTQTQRR